MIYAFYGLARNSVCVHACVCICSQLDCVPIYSQLISEPHQVLKANKGWLLVTLIMSLSAWHKAYI